MLSVIAEICGRNIEVISTYRANAADDGKDTPEEAWHHLATPFSFVKQVAAFKSPMLTVGLLWFSQHYVGVRRPVAH
jgi:hypothetical protein